MYKKISAISDQEEMDEIRSELTDRFGEIPRVTDNLINVAYIKSRAHEVYITEIVDARPDPAFEKKKGAGSKAAKAFKITMLKGAPVDSYQLLDTVRKNADRMKYNINEGYFIYQPIPSPSSFGEIKKTLSEFFDILEPTLIVQKKIQNGVEDE